ncbi:hypothetical protein AYO37_00940 [Opitutia bacterium SCGC AG-212-L18]|nr:hypothetical protein AYO37_00940 [Opitutae bacterium SCGC AG-212-L18]
MSKTISVILILILGLLPVIASPETDLIRAADRGDVNAVKGLLEAGADPKYMDSDALIGAAVKNSVETVKLLLEYGADPKGQNSAALVTATTLGNAEIVKLLLEAGADPKAQDSKAFLTAISAGNPDIINLFIKHGADLELSDKIYDNGNKEKALQLDKELALVRPDNLNQIVNKWINRGEETIALELKNNPRIATRVLDQLIRNGDFTKAEEYGNKMLEYWVSQSSETISKDMDTKLRFAINIHSDYYYDELLENIKNKNEAYIVENYSKYLTNFPLNPNVEDISITDFLTHRAYVNQDFLNKYNISLEDARMLLEMDIYELLKENDIIFSILHATALHAKEDPYYKLHLFDEQPLGEDRVGGYLPALGIVDLSSMALGSYQMRQALAHEWTHLLMQILFDNKAAPFALKDEKAEIAWEQTTKLMWEQVDKAKAQNLDPSTPYGRAIKGYMSIKEYYPERAWASEVIARYPTIIATPEIYNNPQVKEFLKPVADYWNQYVQPAIDKYIKDRAAIDTFISDWKRENISDPFFRSKFNK